MSKPIKCDQSACTNDATRWGLLAVDRGVVAHVATCEYHSYRWNSLWGTWPMDSVDVDAAHVEAMEDHAMYATKHTVTIMVGDVPVSIVPALYVFDVVCGGVVIGHLAPVTWLRDLQGAKWEITKMLAACGVTA